MVEHSTYLLLPGGSVWPNPAKVGDVEWLLRYGDPSKSTLLVAASVLAAYQDLLFKPRRRRDEVVRQIREVLADG